MTNTAGARRRKPSRSCTGRRRVTRCAVWRRVWPPGLALVRDLAARDLFDRLVIEAAGGEVGVDLPLALRVRHIRPARQRSRQRASRLLYVGVRRALAEHDVDDVARDALLRELRPERAIATRLEALALLDPPARERLVVDVALRAQPVDRVVDRLHVEFLRP